MKKYLFLLCFLFFPIHTIFAGDIETEKIQWHLNRVEGILRQVDTGSLSKEQSKNRKAMLDRLHAYTLDGKFPNNNLFPGISAPFFRGSNGNLCAVGYLMDSDPEYTTFIENIVKTHNNIKIMESQNDPMIQKWANKYGFSILELAMIQPTYEFMDKCRLSNTQYCTLRESYELLGKVYENRYSQEITRQNWVDVFQRIGVILLRTFIYILIGCIPLLSMIWLYYRKQTLGPRIKKILYILLILTGVLVVLNLGSIVSDLLYYS